MVGKRSLPNKPDTRQLRILLGAEDLLHLGCFNNLAAIAYSILGDL
ncbi:hypothetical protein HC931_09680 [Candidatus Gracilibacteria bacterium]|nr:hypothetical protein [Candidatus Gracilibacteria bacterium]NJM86490.1 hypothetical protein [Hydrococcus sp. RU_2_2]NJP17954.1 hypothetical protein [Hydrococcus sp. CRU_1_1]